MSGFETGNDRNSLDVERFPSIILGYFRRHGRDFPWRETADPYAILVSEIMLQQTQTSRVLPKYAEFLETFPTVTDLAAASLADVLRHWQGLGYNRRAKYLKACAEAVAGEHNGEFPRTRDALMKLPGIGVYTSGAMCAFAFRQPVVFIDTNIRRVYLHFYFVDADGVHDREILPVLEETLFRPDPRTWYHALMDYGAMLGKNFPNANRRSVHYTRQSAFENSNRQIRGRILNVLAQGPARYLSLVEDLPFDEERVSDALEGLEAEGMIVRDASGVYLPGAVQPPGNGTD